MAPGATKGKQGFASMSQQRRHEIAVLGGKAAQRTGKMHRWTSEQAREAGRKGGALSRKKGPNTRPMRRRGSEQTT